MQGAIDIHHHYVPEEVIGEAKRHGKALGIEVSEDKDGTIRFSFNGGPRYPLLQGLTDVAPRLEMMDEGQNRAGGARSEHATARLRSPRRTSGELVPRLQRVR